MAASRKYGVKTYDDSDDDEDSHAQVSSLGRTDGDRASTARLRYLKFDQKRPGDVGFENSGYRAVLKCFANAHRIVFSNRTIAVNEVVSIRLREIASFIDPMGHRTWSGLRFGVYSSRPEWHEWNRTYKSSFRAYQHDRLENHWDLLLPIEYATPGYLLQFFVSAVGEIHYYINNVHKGIACSNVDTTSKLLVAVDLFGPPKSIQFERTHGASAPMQLASEMASLSSLPPTKPPAIRVDENTKTLPELKAAGLKSEKPSAGRQLDQVTLPEMKQAVMNDTSGPDQNRQVTLPDMKQAVMNDTSGSDQNSQDAMPFFNALLDTIESGDNQNQTSNDCVICMAAERNATFLCGHRSCLACANKTKKSTGLCPFCRKPIKDIIQLF